MDGGDYVASVKKKAKGRARMDSTAPDVVDGVWGRCVAGEHRNCIVRVFVQAPWATSGLAAPGPDSKPAWWESCACRCHGGADSRGADTTPRQILGGYAPAAPTGLAAPDPMVW